MSGKWMNATAITKYLPSYRRWNWGVEYRVKARLKQRHFPTEAEARVMFDRLKRNGENAYLFRFRPTNWFEQTWERLMVLLGFQQYGDSDDA